MEKKNKKNNGDWEIPEILVGSQLRPLHRRALKGARLPQEQVKLQLEKHIVSWFRSEAERQNRQVDSFINEALRQYIVAQVGDPEFKANGLNPVQRAEVLSLVNQIVSKSKQTAAGRHPVRQ